MPIVIYTLSNCDTCRQAVKWLRAQALDFVEKPIRETPPSAAEIGAMLKWQNGEIRKLFNTAGKEYRALNLKDRLDQLTPKEATQLLSSNGNLVKRPFLVSDRVGLVGFDEKTWMEALGSRRD